MRLKLKNGEPSSSLTIAWISFLYCLIAITLGLIEEATIGSNTFKFRLLGSDVIFSLLGPAFGLYGYRRWTETPDTPKIDELRK